MAGINNSAITKIQVIVIIAVIVVASIGGAWWWYMENQPKQIVIKLLAHAYAPLNELEDKYCDKFEEEHPNVKIERDYTEWGSLSTKLWTMIEGGNPPDVIGLHNSWVPALVKGGHLDTPPEDVVDFIETTMIDAAPGLGTFYGTLYGIVKEYSFRLPIVDWNSFEAAGIEDYPTTWDEMASVSELLSKYDAEGNRIKIGLWLDWNLKGMTIVRWKYILYAYGARVKVFRN